MSLVMQVLINQIPHDIEPGATLADVLPLLNLSGPFAAAVNLQFVPKSQYAETWLREGDDIEIIAPVTGG